MISDKYVNFTPTNMAQIGLIYASHYSCCSIFFTYSICFGVTGIMLQNEGKSRFGSPVLHISGARNNEAPSQFKHFGDPN